MDTMQCAIHKMANRSLIDLAYVIQKTTQDKQRAWGMWRLAAPEKTKQIKE